VNPLVQANSRWPKTEIVISGERAVTGRQIDITTVAFMYKILLVCFTGYEIYMILVIKYYSFFVLMQSICDNVLGYDIGRKKRSNVKALLAQECPCIFFLRSALPLPCPCPALQDKRTDGQTPPMLL
jgi:hypothetical protein